MTQTLDTPTQTPAQRAEPGSPTSRTRCAPATSTRAAGMFAATSFWRDLVAFTWNITTVENPDGVADLLAATLDRTDPTGFAADEPPDEADGVTTAWFEFETAVGRGRGLLRLSRRTASAKAWTFLTTLYELKGHEEPRGPAPADGRRARREQGPPDLAGAPRAGGGRSSASRVQPYVLVVGGGQGGIALGARLRQLGVPTIVVDKHARPGDQWRGRYKSLCLHDPVWYDHLPYLKFPDNWPVFSPKDKIADWLESYIKVMELPYWGSTVATQRDVSPEKGEWTVEVERDGQAARAAAEAAGAGHRHVRQAEHPRDPRAGRVPRRPAPLLGAPGPGRLRAARRSSSSAATTPPSTSAARCGRTAPT